MDEEIMVSRKRKFEFIIGLYADRKYRQNDIAHAYNIPVKVVRKVTKKAGYEHGKLKSHVNPNNLNSGQTVQAIITGEELSFLDKYDF